MAPQFLAACFCLVAASSLPCAAGIASAPGPAGVDVTERRRLKDTAGRCGISGTGVSKAHAATMTTQERLNTYTQLFCDDQQLSVGGANTHTNQARRRLPVGGKGGCGRPKPLQLTPANKAKRERNDAKNQAIAKIESYVGRGKFRAVVAQNMEMMCGFFMDEMHAGRPVCGETFTLQATWPPGVGKKITVNCDKTRPNYPAKPAGYPAKTSDMLAVMDLCVSTCMKDRSKTCCQVPAAIAKKFACCRENCCCPDNIDDPKCTPKDKKPVSVTGGYDFSKIDLSKLKNLSIGWTGGLGRRAQEAVLGPRKAQVSVAVTVTVEEGSESESVYDALLRCLQNPAKLDSMCLTGSSGH